MEVYMVADAIILVFLTSWLEALKCYDLFGDYILSFIIFFAFLISGLSISYFIARDYIFKTKNDSTHSDSHR